ncbi:MAG: molybdopterin-dependent oxidoreductase [Candidatus Binatia bacterium]
MSLRIEGLVTTPCAFGFAELAALDEQIDDLSALLPGRVGGAVPVRVLLARAGVRPEATRVTVASRVGFFKADVPLAAAETAVIAYRVGDAPLPQQQGGPLRFFLPDATSCGLEGVDACANVKDVGVLRVL